MRRGAAQDYAPRYPFKSLKASSISCRTNRAYNNLVADIPKVPKAEFDAVLRSLLNAPPMPMADIPRKRGPKAKRAAKKRG